MSKGKYSILPEVSSQNTGLSASQLAELFAGAGSLKEKSKKKKSKKSKKMKKKRAANLAYLLELNALKKNGKNGKKKSKQSKKKVSKRELQYNLIGKLANETIDLVSGIAKMFAISKLNPPCKKIKRLDVVSTK